MKIRIMGTKSECEKAAAAFREKEQEPNVAFCAVSKLYACRGSDKLFRLYVEIIYNK